MTFADLMVGDHYIWPLQRGSLCPDSLNVNIKIASSDNGGGFAIDLATRQDCIDPAGSVAGELGEWIRGEAQVIKLNGRF